MSEKSILVLMANYNQLMNKRIFQAANELSAERLHEDKGAFFKSVFGTLNHILVGDRLWLKRFASHPASFIALQPLIDVEIPKRLDVLVYDDLASLKQERIQLDAAITSWCDEIKEADLDTALEYSDFKGNLHKKRLGDLIQHLFLHQIHHRGQATTLLSQHGVDFGDTDLPEIIPELQ